MEYCKLLQWDSDHFGFNIGTVKSGITVNQENIAAILAWMNQHEIRCLYYLDAAGEFEASRTISDAGFDFVDVRVELENRLAIPPEFPAQLESGLSFRSAELHDLPEMQALAGQSYHHSRFYFDKRFNREKVDELYQIWIKNSLLNKKAMNVIVAVEGNRPVGFITCEKVTEELGQIGLVAVASDSHGRGVGSRLVEHAQLWFYQRGAKLVRVVTQSRNISAQRLYQKHGFRVFASNVWFHKWNEE